VIIFVNVKPGSKENKIIRLSENEYEIRTKERAEKGKANQEVIRILAQEFNVDKKQVIIKNPSYRKKIIEIK